jgi:hypothetical protein
MILPKQELYQRINYMTEDIIGAVHSQCESTLSFTSANARTSNTEVMHDVINDCTIARFEDFHVKPDNGEIQRVQQTFAYHACLGPIQQNGHTI